MLLFEQRCDDDEAEAGTIDDICDAEDNKLFAEDFLPNDFSFFSATDGDGDEDGGPVVLVFTLAGIIRDVAAEDELGLCC